MNGWEGKRRNKTRTEPNMSRIKSLETRPEKIEQINTAVDKIIFRYFAETAASSFQMKIPNIPSDLRILPWAYISTNSAQGDASAAESDAEIVAAADERAEQPDLQDDDDDDDDDECGAVEEAGDDDESQQYGDTCSANCSEGLLKDGSECVSSCPPNKKVSGGECVACDEEDGCDLTCNGDGQEENCRRKTESCPNGLYFISAANAGQLAATTNLADGSVELQLQLLNKDHSDDESGAREHRRHRSREEKREEKHAKRWERKKEKHNRRQYRQYPEHNNVLLEDIENIRRSDSSVVSLKRHKIFIDAPIEFQNLTISFKLCGNFSVEKSHAIIPSLSARMRVKERNGKVHVHIKPVQVRPSSFTIVVHRQDVQHVPTNRQAGRLVTHASKELARLWNSGFPLRNVGLSLEKIYENYPVLQNAINDLKEPETVEAI